MRQVLTNAELAAIHDAGVGLVFNDFTSGPTAGQNNLLHAAECTWVARMLLDAEPDAPPSVAKIFFDSVQEARTWLSSQRGEEQSAWRACTRCRANGDARSGSRIDHAPGAPAPVPSAPHDPFREAEVELLLLAHLRSVGYVVRQRVRVPSGVVDAIATRAGERVVIEAKGEDSGGYGSAQMNFQMAVGQLASRMDDPCARYAIALPMTADFVKVLRTFRGSLAFERLNIAIYAVERNGQVSEIRPQFVSTWIASLSRP